MPALYIILGIIAFFIAVLSVPVFVELEYTDKVKMSVSWLFLKFKIYPNDKPKKEKPKKEKPAKEKPKKEDKPEAAPKEKKDNFIKVFYNNQGFPGILELIGNVTSTMGKFSKGFLRSIYITRLRIKISVTEGDAAKTAIKYGKICAQVYPQLGYICSSCHVKNYSVNILADYCGEKTKGEFETKVGLVPRSVINAGIAFAFRLVKHLLKVIFSNIKYANKAQANTVNQNNNSNKKGGQTQ